MNSIYNYKKRLKNHISNVKKAYSLLLPLTKDIFNFSEKDLVKLEKQIEEHDKSKYNYDELVPYALYFFGERNDGVITEFKKAEALHKSRNPHHKEFWGGGDCSGQIEMPDNFVFEMICDWWSFSIEKNQPLEILDWYNRKKDSMNFAPEVKAKIDASLRAIKQNYSEGEK